MISVSYGMEFFIGKRPKASGVSTGKTFSFISTTKKVVA